MNKILAFSILGIAFSGAILIISVPFLFNPPVGDVVKKVMVGSTIAFVLFAVASLTIRRRLNEQKK